MQQFVGAGLIVGVAGIGVIMVRAVRERRREVGVLRSLGFPARRVAAVMVFEAGFIALEGILIGVAIALVASYGFAAADADWAEGDDLGRPGLRACFSSSPLPSCDAARLPVAGPASDARSTRPRPSASPTDRGCDIADRST